MLVISDEVAMKDTAVDQASKGWLRWLWKSWSSDSEWCDTWTSQKHAPVELVKSLLRKENYISEGYILTWSRSSSRPGGSGRQRGRQCAARFRGYSVHSWQWTDKTDESGFNPNSWPTLIWGCDSFVSLTHIISHRSRP
jgi:hypothetical protein